ncbi:hypothetical protein Tco_0459945 [Tanacetum coccineum]
MMNFNQDYPNSSRTLIIMVAVDGSDGGEVLQAFNLRNNPLKGSTISGMIYVGCVKNGRNERLFIGFFEAKMEKRYHTPNVTGNGPDWLFDVDSLTISMNYMPVIAENQTNGITGIRDNIVTGQAEKKKEYILIPMCITDPLISQDPEVSKEDAEEKPTKMDESGASDKDGKDDQATRSEFERLLQREKQIENPNSTNSINTVTTHVSTAGPSLTNDDPSSPVNAAKASNAF